MAHVTRDRKKLLSRIRRIGGQVTALEGALVEGRECAEVLVQIAAVRGAVNALMMEVLAGHLEEHVAGETDKRRRENELALLTRLMKTHLR